jgi:PKHD-type hydroxylase
MQLKYSYYHFKSVIPPETCQRIIDLGVSKITSEEEQGLNVEAYTFGDRHKSAMPNAEMQGELSRQELKKKGIDHTYVRDSKVTWLNEKWLYDLIHPLIKEANAKAGWNFEWDYSEHFQFTVYNSPGGFYGWHKDGDSDHNGVYRRYIHGVTPLPMKADGKLPEKYTTDPLMIGKVRKLSLTLNLNSPGDYEGGNLKFDYGFHSDGEQFHECEEIRPQGSVIIFPSFLDHCVTPVTAGTRYSLVLWSLGQPFK